MGILALLEQHSISTATTFDRPAIASPASSFDLPRPYHAEERGWKLPAPPSPPMSHYDHPRSDMSPTLAKTEDDASSGNEPPSAQPSHPLSSRPQLPSLSSLFGPPSSVRPLGAPFGERVDSFASSTSGLDRPRILPSPRERSHSGSAAFLPQPLSRTRTAHDPRFDSRTPPPVAPSRTFTGPLRSPPLGAANFTRPPSRSSTGLALLQGRRRDDGPLRMEPHVFDRSHPHHLGRPQELRELSMNFRDLRQAPTGALQSPILNSMAAGSGAASATVEGIPMSKDGLGPKIWTGTHFLPRFVRADEVPGEGMCYFYDDGSHCKTVIDGEMVNAHWGVTKAGKPRKRLAIACMTCREKKIKCDPDFPRCVQCEKFGRQCQFKNAPRGGHATTTSPSTPPAEPDDFRRPGAMAPPATQADMLRAGPAPDGTFSQTSPSISPRTIMRPSSPEITTPSSASSNKRPRLSYDSYEPRMPGQGYPAPPSAPLEEASRPWMMQSAYQPPYERTRAQSQGQGHGIELPRIHEAVLRRPWENDSYVTEPNFSRSTLPSLGRALEPRTTNSLKRSLSPDQ